MAKKGTINSRHEVKKTSNKGGNALKSDHTVARDTKGVGEGTINSRTVSTKPVSSSGTIGRAQPFQTSAAKGKNNQQSSNSPKNFGSVYKSTKPSSGRK